MVRKENGVVDAVEQSMDKAYEAGLLREVKTPLEAVEVLMDWKEAARKRYEARLAEYLEIRHHDESSEEKRVEVLRASALLVVLERAIEAVDAY